MKRIGNVIAKERITILHLLFRFLFVKARITVNLDILKD